MYFWKQEETPGLNIQGYGLKTKWIFKLKFCELVSQNYIY